MTYDNRPVVDPAGDAPVASGARVREREVVREGIDPAYVPPARAAGVVDTGPGVSVVLRRAVVILFGILQALLILRVIFLLLVANRDNSVVSLILGITDPFVEPFRGMFQLDRVSASTNAGRAVLDVAAIVALVGWTLVEALILAVLGLLDRRRDVVA
ncbi:MAG: YggT family protein [Chloroflexota bacterium]|jgi:uncharacterized protein YggT (Ycf19 family)